RMMATMNSAYRRSPKVLARQPHNSLYIHPLDLEKEGLAPGDTAAISSANGTIIALVEADATLRPGIVSMTHCWGSVDETSEADGNVSRLVSIAEKDVAKIDAMPQHSAIPVRIARREGQKNIAPN
ncbi:MAG: molybdopterin dinucleotide binding domain-containing protein, partial [Caulobacterales bacterium]